MTYQRIMLAIILVASSLFISLAADNAGNSSEMPASIPESGLIRPGQTILSNATIGGNIPSLLFVLTWLNATSNLEARLTTPSGIDIDSTAQPPVIYGVNKSLIFYILPNAEKGKWAAMITARDVPDTGESYWALFSTIPENEYTNQVTNQVINDEDIDLSDLENTSEGCQNCSAIS